MSTSKISNLYMIRAGVPDDHNFIMATFLRGLYYGDSWFSKIKKDVFMSNYKNVIEQLLKTPTCVVNVACLREDPEVILGYSVTSSDYQTIHWVYVKAPWRKQGIASSLLPKFPATVSHLSALGYDLLPKVSNPLFNPFKLS